MLLFSYVGRQQVKSIEHSSTYGRAKAAGFRAILPHDCERSWVWEDPNQPDSFGEDVRVGDRRPARLEICQETKDRVRGTEQLGLGVVFHCPFERVASQRKTHPGMLVFNVLIKLLKSSPFASRHFFLESGLMLHTE